jgi:hypothetical protein
VQAAIHQISEPNFQVTLIFETYKEKSCAVSRHETAAQKEWEGLNAGRLYWLLGPKNILIREHIKSRQVTDHE